MLYSLHYFLEFRQIRKEVGVVFDEAAQVGEGQRDALDEVGLALVEAAVAVGSEGLEDADEDIVPKVGEPPLAVGAIEAPNVEVVV